MFMVKAVYFLVTASPTSHSFSKYFQPSTLYQANNEKNFVGQDDNKD